MAPRALQALYAGAVLAVVSADVTPAPAAAPAPKSTLRRMAASTRAGTEHFISVSRGGVMLQWRTLGADSGGDGGVLVGQVPLRGLRAVYPASPEPTASATLQRYPFRFCVRAGPSGTTAGPGGGQWEELCLVLGAASRDQADDWVQGLRVLC